MSAEKEITIAPEMRIAFWRAWIEALLTGVAPNAASPLGVVKISHTQGKLVREKYSGEDAHKLETEGLHMCCLGVACWQATHTPAISITASNDWVANNGWATNNTIEGTWEPEGSSLWWFFHNIRELIGVEALQRFTWMAWNDGHRKWPLHLIWAMRPEEAKPALAYLEDRVLRHTRHSMRTLRQTWGVPVKDVRLLGPRGFASCDEEIIQQTATNDARLRDLLGPDDFWALHERMRFGVQGKRWTLLAVERDESKPAPSGINAGRLSRGRYSVLLEWSPERDRLVGAAAGHYGESNFSFHPAGVQMPDGTLGKGNPHNYPLWIKL